MRTLSVLFLSSIVSLAVFGQGPDVMIGDLNSISSHGNGGSGTTYAYSIGTTACNVGNQVLNWWAATNQHPVIAQNIYRLKNGRFEQIGISWVKHGFGSATGSYCSPCQDPGNSQLCGVGCSDPYTSSTNGDQALLGPRSEVNASTGYFPYPPILNPAWSGALPRRIQCSAGDINPVLNAGATYYAEGHYVTADDAAAGHRNNNASYRMMTFSAGTFSASLTGPTAQQQPAILAWQAADPSVTISYADFPNDGRFIIAKKVTSLGAGNYHYEIAVHNLNSDRSGRGLTVAFTPGTVITNAGFEDVEHHSGEPWSGTDWATTINGASINWATDLYITNQNANALRWGTLYNFWFDATASATTNVSIELFKPAPCPADPVVPASQTYTLNNAAAFDNPAIAGASGPSGDDQSLYVPIPFSFSFYGAAYSSLWISTNGFVTFASSNASSWDNVCLPNPVTPNAMIAGYWDDLFPAPGQITYQTIGFAPNRRFVVWWHDVELYPYGSAQLQNFKIILDETTNNITSTIISSSAGGVSATRGIERQDGLVGQGSCNTAGSAVAGTSWTWTSVTTIPPSADLAISGSTGQSGTLTWSVNSSALGARVVLVASLDMGPTSLGSLGTLNIGFTPGAFAVIADGFGVFQPANPAAVTDACGDFSISIPLGPGGLPPGMTIYNQGAIKNTTGITPPPNGLFHITDMETINT